MLWVCGFCPRSVLPGGSRCGLRVGLPELSPACGPRAGVPVCEAGMAGAVAHAVETVAGGRARASCAVTGTVLPEGPRVLGLLTLWVRSPSSACSAPALLVRGRALGAAGPCQPSASRWPLYCPPPGGCAQEGAAQPGEDAALCLPAPHAAHTPQHRPLGEPWVPASLGWGRACCQQPCYSARSQPGDRWVGAGGCGVRDHPPSPRACPCRRL